jgi:cytochrome c oxidase assembly factor CtaG
MGQRLILTFAIVVAILLVIAAYGYFTGSWEVDVK